MSLLTVSQLNGLCAGTLGFVFNFLLFFLIARKTPAAMRSYARIMRVHCVSDILYNSGLFITGFHPVPIGGKVYVVAQGFYTHVNLSILRLVISWYFWEILLAIALLPIDFYYRFKSVCHNVELRSRTIYLQVALAYFITWLHAFPNSFNYVEIGPRPETAEYTAELTKFDEFKGLHGVPSYGVSIMGGAMALSNFIFILLLNGFVYSVIVYTSVRIHRTLRARTRHTAKAINVQRQVTRILMLQAFLPLVVFCIPTIVVVLLALTHVDAPGAAVFVGGIHSWLSAVKPAATILVVARYRAFVRARLFDFGSSSVHSIDRLPPTITEFSAADPQRPASHVR